MARAPGATDAVVASGRFSQPLPPTLRRVLDAIIVSFAGMFLGVGLWLVIGRSLLLSDVGRYNNAPVCPDIAAVRAGADCVASIESQVLGAQLVIHDAIATPLVTVLASSLSTQPITLRVSRPSGEYYHLHVGQTEYLRVWQGRVSAVCPQPLSSNTCGGFRTVDSPYIADAERLAAGLYAAGMGALLLLVHPPRRLAVIIRRRTRWHDPDDNGAVGQLLHHPALGAAFMTFIAFQILDIITSIYDGAASFFEANPLANLLIDTYGATAGFVAIKLPATIALFLGAARLPRRLALTVMLVGIIVFAYIVLENVALYATAHPAPA